MSLQPDWSSCVARSGPILTLQQVVTHQPVASCTEMYQKAMPAHLQNQNWCWNCDPGSLRSIL
jgi:hypothetical protein